MQPFQQQGVLLESAEEVCTAWVAVRHCEQTAEPDIREPFSGARRFLESCYLIRALGGLPFVRGESPLKVALPLGIHAVTIIAALQMARDPQEAQGALPFDAEVTAHARTMLDQFEIGKL